MDDGLIVFLVLLIAAILLSGIVSFFLVLGTRSRLSLLERGVLRVDTPDLRILSERITALERRLATLEGPSETPFAPPEQPKATPQQKPVSRSPFEEPDLPPLPSLPPEPETPPAEPVDEQVPAALPTAAPAARPDLETRLGTRWTVWLGGLALAFGGIFLVRYSIEQGLLGPVARVVSGLAFAALLLGAGEFLRRKGAEPDGPNSPFVSIPGIVTAAGTMSAFASIYAAFALYDLLPPAAAFLLLGVVALTTMLSAMLHGPSLAALGLVGALVVPILIGGGGDAWPLVIYFAIVSAASFGLARVRRWKWLAIAAVAGAVAWAILMGDERAMLDPARAHIVVQFILAALSLIAGPFRGIPDEQAKPDRFSHILLIAFAAIAIISLLQGQTPSLRFAGTMAGLALITGFFFAPAAGAMAMAGLILLATTFLWPNMVPAILEGSVIRPDQPPALPEAIDRFLLFAGIGSLTVLIAAGIRLMRGRDLPLVTAGFYAAPAIATPLLALLIAWWRITGFGISPNFAIAAGILAAVLAIAAGSFLKAGSPARLLAAEAAAAGAIAALTLGLTIGLERANLTLSLSLAAAGTAWVTARGPLNSLRYAVGALGLGVLGRLVWDPNIVVDPGSMPIFNWLLVGYGVPALAFFIATRLLRQRGEDWPLRLSESLTVLFAALLCLFEIRHFATGGAILSETTNHLELGLQVTVALAFSAILMRLESARPNPVYRIASFVFSLLSILAGISGLCIRYNPLLDGQVIGGPIVNSLLIAYGAPAIAALVLARQALGRRPLGYVRCVLAFALIMLFLLVTLETRQVFQGARIDILRSTSNAELWSYSVVWLAMGIALLAGGLATGSRMMRFASAALILATTAKAFLIDMSGLEGIWRAASFIGLGFVLIGIGLVYQRVLRRKPVVDG